MKLKHPYEKYEDSSLWKLLEKAVNELIENQDIELTTRKEYVIGYFCKVMHPKLEKLVVKLKEEKQNLKKL